MKVPKGGFLTLFGPNGAGKTTLIRLLATLTRPDSGTLRIDGWDALHHGHEIRQRIGLVTHQTLLYNELTGYENLKFYGRMYSIPNLEERIHTVVEQVGMSHRLHDRVRNLSHGMQKRLAIARAVLHNPSVILLDEPETGLDQHATAMLIEVINGLHGGRRTVVMTTHSMERGLDLADHVAILVNGRIAYAEERNLVDVESFQGTYFRYTEAKR